MPLLNVRFLCRNLKMYMNKKVMMVLLVANDRLAQTELTIAVGERIIIIT